MPTPSETSSPSPRFVYDLLVVNYNVAASSVVALISVIGEKQMSVEQLEVRMDPVKWGSVRGLPFVC